MAVSNWRSDGYESISVSTTTVRLGRRLSTWWRTINVPVRADDIQWMWRWSSPSSYSRRAWKATSPAGEASDVGPSRSLANPTGSGASAVTRGCTHSVCVPVCTISRRISASRSDLTISAGPTSMTPRRAVGRGYTASVERPGPSGGTSRRNGRPRTWSSMVREEIGAAPRVGDAHDGDRRVTDGDAIGLQRALDVEGEPADDERQGDEQGDEAAGGDDHQLDPPEQPAADVGDGAEDGDGPPARRQRDPAAANCRAQETDSRPRSAHTSPLHACWRAGRAARRGRGPRRRGRWCRPCSARPRASAACGGPSRPGRRCARRRA